MSLHKFAEQVAANGRGDDSLLVHMTPDEVRNLQKFAQANGTTLTINPETGLPEAGLLSDLFKAVAPMALGAFLGPAGAAIGGGFMSAGMAGLTVGGLTTLATGSLSRGLMAGLGAYGGAGLADSLLNAGTGGLAAADIAAQQAAGGFPTLVEGATQEQILKHGAEVSALRDAAVSKAGEASLMSKASAGLGSIASNPAAYGSDLFKFGSAAAAPIMAGAMVPTTTKMPEATDTGYIRQKVFDPGTQTYRSLAPIKANEWKDRSFSDIYRGYNGGGIVALAGGGAGTDAVAGAGATTPPAITSVEDLYRNVLGREGEAEGLAFWKQGFGDTIDPNEIASFRQAAQAELANRTLAEQQQLAPNLMAANTATTGGVTNLAATGNTAAAADTSGIAALTGGATTGATTGATGAATSLADAQTMVNNMYRNVLGRDADPEGLRFWSGAIAAGRSPESIYQDFLTSARANTELVTADQIKNKTFADATKAYTGYMSADTSNIVDDWVRNTLGREPTAADKQQQWYKDAYTSMSTQGQAKGLYDQFLGYAGTEAKTEIANRIKAIDAELRTKGLTDADLLAQTGKTKQQLATEGIDLSRNLIGASQLAPAGGRTAFNLKAKLAELKPITNTFGGDAVDRTVTNPYGNATNPGDLTYNRDGSVTVTPNIPYRPYGGFSGMGEVKNAYTQGGGSLGYVSPVIKTPAEHEAAYNTLTGDSEAAYKYLMGKGANPTKSKVGEIAKPYKEATLGYAPSTNKAYTYDAATGKMVRNPDYVPVSYNSEGQPVYGLSNNDIKSYIDNFKTTGGGGILGGIAQQVSEAIAVPEWMATNNVSYQQLAEALGISVAEARKRYPPAAKKVGTGVGASGTYDGGSGGVGGNSGGPSGGSDGAIGTGGMGAEGGDGAQSGGGADNARGGLMPHGAYHMANGGMMGYAVGGGLGSLGSYSDGGRLLKGPGDGVSDSIPATIGAKQQPARLADGEFVVPARIVSELGNGSTDAGAKKLYAMMDRVQRARGKTTGKNKVAANSRADKYLPA